MQKLYFVLLNKYGCWSHERTHSIANCELITQLDQGGDGGRE